MEIIKNTRGGQKLCFGGHMYTKKFTRNSHIRWECAQRRAFICKGSVTTDLSVKQALMCTYHSHDSDELKVQATKIRATIKEQATTTNDKPSQIIAKCAVSVPIGVRAALGRMDSVKRSIRYQKRGARHKTETPIQDLKLDEKWTPFEGQQDVLWRTELKSVENVNQKSLDTYKSEPPSENTLKEWMGNFTKFGNVEERNRDQLSSPKKKKHSDYSSCCNQGTTKQQKEDLNNLQQRSKSFGGGDNFSFDDKTTTLENIRKLQEDFCNQRSWNQHHSPQDILLALVGEVGELAEIFQWKGEVKKGIPSFTDAEKEHVGEELGDVLIYLIRLADRCEIDLPKAALKKFEKNAKKYPADKIHNLSKKYTEYENN